MKLLKASGALALALVLGLAAAPALAQTQTVFAPSNVVPLQACAYGAYGEAATACSEANPLPVRGDVVLITASPTVSTTAYAADDVMGGKMTFANVALRAGGTGLIQEVSLAFKSSQTSPIDFVFCSSDPSGTTFTDNAAVALAAADYNKCRAIHVTDCADLGTPSVCTAGNLAFPFDLSSGTTGYGFLVSRGTPTLGSTSDVEVQVRVLRN